MIKKDVWVPAFAGIRDSGEGKVKREKGKGRREKTMQKSKTQMMTPGRARG
jgi:hypothetical protein